MALFLFFRIQERDKKTFIMSLSGKPFSEERVVEWMNLCQQNYLLHTISLELGGGKKTKNSVQGVNCSALVLKIGSGVKFEVWFLNLCWATTPWWQHFYDERQTQSWLGFKALFKVKRSTSTWQASCKKPRAPQIQSYLLRHIRQPRASIKLCL